MDNVTLEITVTSAENLKNARRFGRLMRTYASVWTDPNTQNCTRVDREGGRYPTWNEKLQMPVSQKYIQQKGSALIIQIYCKTVLGKKQVGWTKMPYSDVLEGYGKLDSVRFLSYRLRRPNGKPRGTVNFSLRFSQKIDQFLRISTPRADLLQFPDFSSKSKSHPNSSVNYPNWQRHDRQRNAAPSTSYAIGIPLSLVPQPQFPYMQQRGDYAPSVYAISLHRRSLNNRAHPISAGVNSMDSTSKH
eukprot:Gb_28884 [translate_table: standard]